MEYSAVGLALIGAAVGIAFRWKVLLPIICLLPCVSIIFSISHGLGFRDAVVVVVATQVILQGGYFVGLLIRPIASACIRSAPWISSFLKSRRRAELTGADQHNAPRRETGKGL